MASRTRLAGLLALVCSSLLVAATGGPAGGDEREAAQTEAWRRGRFLYQFHCASCHGPEGHGDGPLAEVLTVHPLDLTRIRERRDGAFPEEELATIIDGRSEVLGHGTREMPVWGLTFQEEGRVTGQEEEVRVRVEQLIQYLETLQR